MSQPRQMEREACVCLPGEAASGCSCIADEAGIYTFHPMIPGYPKARFPGVVVFSEIYQGTPIRLHTKQILTDIQSNRSRRPLRPPNRRTGLHLRRPINLPRIHRPGTPRLQRRRHEQRQQMESHQETGGVRRGRGAGGGLPAFAANVQWAGWGDGDVSGGAFGVSVCIG